MAVTLAFRKALFPQSTMTPVFASHEVVLVCDTESRENKELEKAKKETNVAGLSLPLLPLSASRRYCCALSFPPPPTPSLVAVQLIGFPIS
jgi:hypothetical protein